MVLEVVKASELNLDGGLGKCIPIFSGNKIIKVGYDEIKISVINQNNKSQISSIFTGHEKVIFTIACSQDGRILCSCSEDKVILWDLCSSRSTGGCKNGVVIGENIGCCTHCAMSCSNKWLSLCILREIWIVHLSKNLFTPGNGDGFHSHAILKTDSNQINSCSFSSESEDLLVSVEDFNHFKVWNLLSSSLIYRSATMINSCISFCAFSGCPNKLLICSTTGSIYVYKFGEKYIPALCRTFSITKKDFMVGEESNPVKAKSEEQWVSNGCMVYSASIFSEDRTSKNNDASNTDSKIYTAKEMLASITSLGSILVSACNLGVIIHSLKSCDCLGLIPFSDQRIFDPLPSAMSYLIEYIILTGESTQNIQCYIKNASSQKKLYCFKLSYKKSESQFHKFPSIKCGAHISLLSRSPLCNKSPLSYNVKLSEKHSYAHEISKPGLNNVAKVKSSGYGKGPRVKMFSPITNETRNNHFKSKKITNVFHKNHINHEKNALNCGPPVHMESNILICKTSGISGRLAYSEWLISSSSDSTVRVWDWRNRHCILKIDAENLVMAGCSNRDIIVYDLNHESFLCTFKEAHVHRPPHRLVQLTGSTCPRIPAHTPSAYNLFLSASIKDGAKLWDLRTPKCIQKYDRHLSKVYASGVNISPCCRFVAACSEDKQVYIYDTRKCENYLHTISSFPDAVMDVAFSPCMTQLAALSLNGHLMTF
ncbi:hypothetical protein J437_LFUL003561, partial [Ladona fulva]